MPAAIGVLLALQRIEVERFRELEIAHILGNDGEILQAERNSRMVVAEHPAIYIQRPFVSLLRKKPLLLEHVYFRQVAQHGGHVDLRSPSLFQDVETANVQILRFARLPALESQHPQRPERMPGRDANGARACAL